jgi:hypothetical protein
MHGIFPTYNKYYIRKEIFPYLSKKEMKEVYYPTKKPKTVAPRKVKSSETEE